VKKFTASVVGGGTGGRASLAALAASQYEPVALADLQLEVCRALQRTYPALQAFTDFREMFRVFPTDIVPDTPITIETAHQIHLTNTAPLSQFGYHGSHFDLLVRF
jgi:hypothetical protein